MDGVAASENKELTARARGSLKGRWGLAVVGFAIYPVINIGLSLAPVEPLAGITINLLVAGPFGLGMAVFGLSLARRGTPSLSQVFDGFDGVGRFGTALASYALMVVFILLWLLLLIIPGIVAALSYAMVFFVLADDDEIGPLEALSRSREMMRGHRWMLFRLWLRFVGWYLLAILTLGIGFLWIYPYQMVSFAQFYEELAKPGSPLGRSGATRQAAG